MCDQTQAIAILSEVCVLCNPVLGNRISDAYLYGSYARGDYDRDSDIDIFIAVDMDADEISIFRRNISEITSGMSLKHDITVSVAVEPAKQFAQYVNVLPYYKNVVKEGIRYAGARS